MVREKIQKSFATICSDIKIGIIVNIIKPTSILIIALKCSEDVNKLRGYFV